MTKSKSSRNKGENDFKPNQEQLNLKICPEELLLVSHKGVKLCNVCNDCDRLLLVDSFSSHNFYNSRLGSPYDRYIRQKKIRTLGDNSSQDYKSFSDDEVNEILHENCLCRASDIRGGFTSSDDSVESTSSNNCYSDSSSDKLKAICVCHSYADENSTADEFNAICECRVSTHENETDDGFKATCEYRLSANTGGNLKEDEISRSCTQSDDGPPTKDDAGKVDFEHLIEYFENQFYAQYGRGSNQNNSKNERGVGSFPMARWTQKEIRLKNMESATQTIAQNSNRLTKSVTMKCNIIPSTYVQEQVQKENTDKPNELSQRNSQKKFERIQKFDVSSTILREEKALQTEIDKEEYCIKTSRNLNTIISVDKALKTKNESKEESIQAPEILGNIFCEDKAIQTKNYVVKEENIQTSGFLGNIIGENEAQQTKIESKEKSLQKSRNLNTITTVDKAPRTKNEGKKMSIQSSEFLRTIVITENKTQQTKIGNKEKSIQTSEFLGIIASEDKAQQTKNESKEESIQTSEFILTPASEDKSQQTKIEIKEESIQTSGLLWNVVSEDRAQQTKNEIKERSIQTSGLLRNIVSEDKSQQTEIESKKESIQTSGFLMVGENKPIKLDIEKTERSLKTSKPKAQTSIYTDNSSVDRTLKEPQIKLKEIKTKSKEPVKEKKDNIEDEKEIDTVEYDTKKTESFIKDSSENQIEKESTPKEMEVKSESFVFPKNRPCKIKEGSYEYNEEEKQVLNDSLNYFCTVSKQFVCKDVELEVTESEAIEFFKDQQKSKTAMMEYETKKKNEDRKHRAEVSIVPYVEKPSYLREDGVDIRFSTPSERDILTSRSKLMLD